MKTPPRWQPEALLRSPLFAPLHPLLARLPPEHFPALDDCNALLAACAPAIHVTTGKRLRFVAQQHGKLPFDAQYEPRCYLAGEVQTREHNWHDLFNALVWLAFPASKAAINARHYQSLRAREAHAAGSQRGSARDMLTLLDESGVVVACAAGELERLLRDFRWHELFWEQRARVNSAMGFYLFGHGLYEKALCPYVGFTGQGLVLPVEAAFFGWPAERRLAYLDRALADYLAQPENCLNTRELTPVPLLGIPGWCAENSSPEYYKNNTGYFRSGRLSSNL